MNSRRALDKAVRKTSKPAIWLAALGFVYTLFQNQFAKIRDTLWRWGIEKAAEAFGLDAFLARERIEVAMGWLLDILAHPAAYLIYGIIIGWWLRLWLGSKDPADDAVPTFGTPDRVKELAKDCLQLSEALSAFIAHRMEDYPTYNSINGPGDLDRVREKRDRYEQARAAKVKEKLGAEVIRINHLLELAKIPTFSQIWMSSSHSITNVASYLGTVGRLLNEEKIDEARHLNPWCLM